MHIRVYITLTFLGLISFAMADNRGNFVDNLKKNRTEEPRKEVTNPEDAKKDKAPDPFFVLSGSAGFVSDYLNRGKTQTFGKPAVQGELIISQQKEDGLYGGLWGSNINNETAPNGAGLELNLYGGYKYKHNDDLLFKLDLKSTMYPGSRANLPTKDKFNMLEITPGIKYKYLSSTFAYSILNMSGVSNNFAPTFTPPLKRNGNSKGSWYSEITLEYPLIPEILVFKLTYGYQYVRHYRKLNYNLYTTGLNYTLPASCCGIIVSINGSVNDARKSLNKVTNGNGHTINIARPRLWVGIAKEI